MIVPYRNTKMHQGFRARAVLWYHDPTTTAAKGAERHPEMDDSKGPDPGPTSFPLARNDASENCSRCSYFLYLFVCFFCGVIYCCCESYKWVLWALWCCFLTDLQRLDVSRHFFYPADVKHFLKTMALFKMNHFHWHLTDDQGWRFPVAKYPNLIRLGAFRRGTPVGHTLRTDHQPYNHSYTELEIEDVITFAESLYIKAPWKHNSEAHV